MRGQRRSLRRKHILEAALGCFLQYGYAKTALDDVAREAGVSRSLLYTYFTDKTDLFVRLVNDLLDAQRGKTEQVLASRASRKDKFFRIMELWGVDLYALGAASPHGHELLDEGNRVWDKIGHKHADALVQALSGFVAGGAAAEVITLAIKGMQADHPTVPVLRKRIHLLAELGWKGRP